MLSKAASSRRSKTRKEGKEERRRKKKETRKETCMEYLVQPFCWNMAQGLSNAPHARADGLDAAVYAVLWILGC